MDAAERHELVAAVIEGLEKRGAADGARLADLMRVEHELQDALAVVRRQIDVIVEATRRQLSEDP